ncbi:MAG: 4Fe-4S binding protein [Betaproteobacteria bacterium]|nr:4Fe-4S binding protein [Betaproteobacteria bacterium]
MADIQIDKQLCDGCGDCVKACPMEIFLLKEEKATAINVETCMDCELCEVGCPNLAIKVTG